MAEFCIGCFNKINETNEPEGKYIMSKEPSLCEECGEWKTVVIVEKKHIIYINSALFYCRFIYYGE